MIRDKRRSETALDTSPSLRGSDGIWIEGAGATGGLIVCLQTLIFLLAFLFAPRHGYLAARRRAAATSVR